MIVELNWNVIVIKPETWRELKETFQTLLKHCESSAHEIDCSLLRPTCQKAGKALFEMLSEGQNPFGLGDEFKSPPIAESMPPDGKPIDPDNFRSRVFYKLLEEAELSRLRIHDLRHSYASLLLAAGAQIIYVSKQLGHASVQTTLDIYAHAIPELNRDALNLLDD